MSSSSPSRHVPARFSSLVLLFGVWTATGLLSPAPAWAGSIHGLVTDPDGRGVPAARVILTSPLGVAATTSTDRQGAFRLSAVSAGRYELHVALDGFRGVSDAFELADHEDREVPVVLSISAVAESVVVSASQVDVPLSRTPDSVTVISRADLEARQVETVADALRLVPGLTIARTGGRGGITSLFPRGGESDFSLVLIDGVRTNAFGGGFDFSQLPVSSIDRIEVVRGPQSALFGSDAIGGVVQVVTRHGGPPGVDVSFETGGQQTIRASATAYGSRGPWSWGASGERTSTDGFEGTAAATGERVSNDDHLAREGSASLGWQNAAGSQVRAGARVFSDERGFPGPFGSNPIGAFSGVDRVSRGLTDGRQFNVRASQPWPSSRVRQRGQVSFTDLDGGFRSPFGLSETETRRVSARTQTDMTLGPTLGASVGLEYQRERARSSFITGASSEPIPIRRQVIGYFGEVRYEAARRLNAAGGVRVERIRRDRLEPSADPFSSRPAFDVDTVVSANPKIALSYLARAAGRDGAATRLRASFGTGIRPPDAFEIAFTDNPNLKPERSRSIDVGASQTVKNERLVLDATAFWNRYDDLIVAVGRAARDISRFQTDNISNARARGLELSAAARAGTGFTARLAYTLLDTEILAVDGGRQAPAPFKPGDRLLRRPKHQASLDVRLSRRRIDAFAIIAARGRTLDIEPSFGAFGGLFSNSGYAVVHTGASVRINSRIDLYGRVLNLFDRGYEEALGFPALGRTGLAGVRFASRR